MAERLGIEAGAAVMRTNYRFFADENPVMLSTSYEPLELTERTAIENPKGSPTTGVVGRMDLIDVAITHVIKGVKGRSPRPYEQEALQVPTGVPVLAVERTCFAGERAVETADTVVGADRYMFSHAVQFRHEIRRISRRVMPLKVGEMIRLIESDGWTLKRTRGSHRQYAHPTKPDKVTIAGKPSSTLRPGTEASILRQAGVERRSS